MKLKWLILFFALRSSLALDHQSFNVILQLMKKLGPHYEISFYGCDKMYAKSLSNILSNYSYLNTCTHKFDKFSTSIRNWRRQLFIVDLNCRDSSAIFARANQEKLFAFPYAWLVIYENIPLQHLIENEFYGLNIMVDSNFHLLELQGHKSLSLCKIFRNHKFSKTYQIENIKLQDGEVRDITVIRRNIGVRLNVSSVIMVNDSYNHLTDKRDGYLDPMAKIYYALLPIMTSKFNISLNFMFSDKWGTWINESYGFSGMMRELITTKTAEIAGVAIFMRSKRVHQLDYVAVTTPSSLRFLFRQPKLSYVSNIYTMPFDNAVWLSIFGLTALLILSICVFIKWERTFEAKFSAHQEASLCNKNDAIVSDATLLTVSAFCQQDSVYLPTRLSGRIGTFVVFLSLFFISVSYSAKILALLQSSSNSITTVQDLVYSKMSAGAHDTDYHRYFFGVEKDPVKKALIDNKIAVPGKPPNYMTIEEGLHRIRTDQFAFQVELGPAYYIIKEEKCGLYAIDYLNFISPLSSLQKNSSYKELLKFGFRLIQEIGIQQRENDLIYTKKPRCQNAAEFINVSIVDIYPVLVFFLAGWVVSIFILILEVLYYSRLNFFKANSTYIRIVNTLKKKWFFQRQVPIILENHQ